MAERVAAVAGIAERKRGRKVKLSSRGYLAATRRPRPELGFGRRPLEGFLFPATYDFTARTTSAQLAAKQLEAFRRNWSKVNLSYARSKHLTPYDVLIIGSMVEKETLSPDERELVAAVIYNRLHERMALQIDATLRYGLHIPPTESIRQSQLAIFARTKASVRLLPRRSNTKGTMDTTGRPVLTLVSFVSLVLTRLPNQL